MTKETRKVAVPVEDTNNANGLKSIKRADPFLYHSIPSVKRARMLHEVRTAHQSTKSLQHSVKKESSHVTLERNSRISVESYPSILAEDLMIDNEDESEELEEFDIMDYFHFNTRPPSTNQ